MTEGRSRTRLGRWIALAGVAAMAGLGVFAALDGPLGGQLLPRTRAAEPAAAPPPVPVITATAARRDVPIYLVGIGNVLALYSVQMRAQVTGYLTSVNFTEGQMVRKGDLLAVIDPRPYQAALDQAAAQKARDEANLVAAQLDFKRYRVLAEKEFQSWQSVDDQKATVDSLKASIAADEANIETAALNLSFTHIISPVDGRVGLRLVDPGNLIHATDAQGLVSVTQIQPITAVFTLPEQDLPRVTEAMARGKVKVFTFAADHRTLLSEGELLTPDNQIDTGTGTIKLKALFTNADNRLWPGQFVDARVEVGKLHDAVTVPAVAVERGPDGLHVFVVKDNSTISVQPVEEALEQDHVAVIRSGLSGGEHVVINGQSRIAAGVRVAARAEDERADGAGAAPRPGG